jgi:hypothetical protein
MAIIVTSGGRDAEKIDKSDMEAEDFLQKFIYDNPESLPLDDIKEDIRLLILAREFPTGSGPIDALGIDKDGEIYVVETKLYKNPDKRLVLAQVLDYGAALWRGYANFNDFLRTLEEHAQNQFHTSLNQKLKDFFGITDDDLSTLLDALESNLTDGNFRFVVLMNRLQDRLKDLIIFMNRNSRFDIFGVEMEFYKFKEYEIVIPKLFGSEVKVKVGISTGATGRKKWEEGNFFEDVRRRLPEKDVDCIRRLYQFSARMADAMGWGRGLDRGSFNPKFSKVSARSMYTVYSDGVMRLNFGWLNDTKKAEEYSRRFREGLQGLVIPEGYGDDYATLSIQEWAPKLDEFTKILEGLLA